MPLPLFAKDCKQFLSAKIKANQKYLKLIQIADDWAEVKTEDKI